MTDKTPGQQALIACEFLSCVYSEKDSEVATDIVFGFVDKVLNDGDFTLCNEILRQVDIGRLTTSLMRSFLATTFAAKEHLSERVSLYDRISTEMAKRRGKTVAHRLISVLR